MPQPPLNPRSVLLVGGMTSERRSYKRTSVRKRPHQLRNMCTHGARKERRKPDLSLTRSSRKAVRSRMNAIMMMIAEELAHANTKHIHTHDARMSRCCLRCRMRWRYKLPALSGEIRSSQGVGRLPRFRFFGMDWIFRVDQPIPGRRRAHYTIAALGLVLDLAVHSTSCLSAKK